MTAAAAGISVAPANVASWEDLQAVFGTRGQASRCQCQRYKLQPRESFKSFPAEERAFRLRQQTDCGHPDSEATSGLVAYLEGEPVGWCAVEPRPAYSGLVRNNRVPWSGRAEDKTDDGVWAVTCVDDAVCLGGAGAGDDEHPLRDMPVDTHETPTVAQRGDQTGGCARAPARQTRSGRCDRCRCPRLPKRTRSASASWCRKSLTSR